MLGTFLSICIMRLVSTFFLLLNEYCSVFDRCTRCASMRSLNCCAIMSISRCAVSLLCSSSATAASIFVFTCFQSLMRL